MLQEAMKMIKPEMTVSFGGGSTVARLAKYLCDEDETLRKTLKVTTPSLETMEVLNRLNYQIVALDDVEKIDVAFDGCDYVTQNLNAQKCMGGIHVDEKKAAKKALRYVLLTKPERIGKTYNAKLPICAEVEQDEADLFLKMADQAVSRLKTVPESRRVAAICCLICIMKNALKQTPKMLKHGRELLARHLFLICART